METETAERSRLDELSKLASMPTNLPVAVVPGSIPFVVGAQNLARYRDDARIKQKIRAIAAAAGDVFYYRIPFKNRKKGTTEWVEGPSIRLANAVAREYGNCEITIYARDVGDGWILDARFIDLESGYAAVRPFGQRRDASKLGGDDDGRRIEIAFAIGVSKSFRNVVVNVLGELCDFAFEEARKSLVERVGKDLANYRATTIERVRARVDLARVEAVIGRPAAEWLAPDVALVIAMMKTVADGMAGLDETFPPLNRPGAAEIDAKVSANLDALATKDIDQSPAGSPPETGDDDSELSPESSTGAAEHSFSAGTDDSAALKKQMLDKVLSIAGDKAASVESRLESLDLAMPAWLDELEHEQAFVRKVFESAVNVAKGATKPDAARKYLEAKGGMS